MSSTTTSARTATICSAYAKTFFREGVNTPWGPAIDFERPQVRDFFFDNALYWLREYRFDGLRLDAVHAIDDDEWLRELVGPRPQFGGSGAPCASRAGERAQHVEPAGVAFQRAMERRLAQHAARPPDGRGRELLQRVHRQTHRKACARAVGRLRVSGRSIADPRRQAARRTERAPAADVVRDVPAEPRSGRQPRDGRAPALARLRRSAVRRDGPHAAVAANSAALHGGAVRLEAAVPVLHRLSRRTRRCRARRASP